MNNGLQQVSTESLVNVNNPLYTPCRKNHCTRNTLGFVNTRANAKKKTKELFFVNAQNDKLNLNNEF